jgi:hypothetical protein
MSNQLSQNVFTKFAVVQNGGSLLGVGSTISEAKAHARAFTELCEDALEAVVSAQFEESLEEAFPGSVVVVATTSRLYNQVLLNRKPEYASVLGGICLQDEAITY